MKCECFFVEEKGGKQVVVMTHGHQTTTLLESASLFLTLVLIIHLKHRYRIKEMYLGY